eukprot:g2038.t1
MQLVSLGGEEGEEVAGPQSLESAGHVFSPTTPAPVHAPAPTRPHQRQQQELREKLTLVVTTSPVASNPDTSMLHEVLATCSFADELLECPKVFVCDGVKIKEKAKYRAGQVTKQGAMDYSEFKQRVRQLTQSGSPLFAHSQVLELDERQGFGYALKAAILKPGLICTPYVLVLQHDRTFMRSLNLPAVIRAMDGVEGANYVGFPSSTVLNHGLAPEGSDVHQAGCGPSVGGYLHFVASKYKVYLAPHVLTPPELGGSKLVPLVQWYDSTHVARLNYYREFVYSRKKLRVKKGGFIEDKLGQQQLQEIKEGGMAAFTPYGTYVLDDLTDRLGKRTAGERQAAKGRPSVKGKNAMYMW